MVLYFCLKKILYVKIAILIWKNKLHINQQNTFKWDRYSIPYIWNYSFKVHWNSE